MVLLSARRAGGLNASCISRTHFESEGALVECFRNFILEPCWNAGLRASAHRQSASVYNNAIRLCAAECSPWIVRCSPLF